MGKLVVMIIWQSDPDEDTYPYGPPCHVWERDGTGKLMEGILTEEQFKKNMDF